MILLWTHALALKRGGIGAYQLTLAVNQDIGALSVGAQQNGVVVYLHLREAWEFVDCFQELFTARLASVLWWVKLNPRERDSAAYSVGDAISKPDEVNGGYRLFPFWSQGEYEGQGRVCGV